MSLLMIHKANMPVYSDPDFSCGTDGTDGTGRTDQPKVVPEVLADLKILQSWCNENIFCLPFYSVQRYEQKHQILEGAPNEQTKCSEHLKTTETGQATGISQNPMCVAIFPIH